MAAVAAGSLAALERLGERRMRAWDPRLPWLVDSRPAFREEGGWIVPEGALLSADGVNPRRFSAVKPAGTTRIVCLGQSTTEGYPFHPRGGYPEWLSRYLADLLPASFRIEVVNAGVSGADSTNDLAELERLVQYEPDVLVLYEGNNEGPLANLRAAGPRLGRIITAFAGVRWMGRRRIEDPSMMGRYVRNVERMLALARERSIPVVLLGQVNLKRLDQPEERSPYNDFLASRAGGSVAFVDLPAAFVRSRRRSGGVIPDLLLDTVHPSLAGQQLVARELARELARRSWIAPAGRWRWARLRPEAAYRRALGLSDDFVAKGMLREVAYNAHWADARAPLVVASMLRGARRSGLAPDEIRSNVARTLSPDDPVPEFLARELEGLSR